MAKQRHPREPQTHALYRFYGAGGTLLYIGITNEIPRRLKQHNGDKPWWLGVSNITVEHYPSRSAVLEAEKRAIVAEKPLYNEVHNGQQPAAGAESELMNATDSYWAQGYLMIANAILDTFPKERAAEYRKKARAAVAVDEPSLARIDLNTAALSGAAAIVAFEDVYEAMTDLAQAVQDLCNALPVGLRDDLMARVRAEIKGSPGLGGRDMARLFLEHFTAQFTASTAPEGRI